MISKVMFATVLLKNRLLIQLKNRKLPSQEQVTLVNTLSSNRIEERQFIIRKSFFALNSDGKHVSDNDVIGTQVKSIAPPQVDETTTVAGTVWAENDRDGIYQTGDEATVEGVSVILHNEDGSVSATTKTNKYGNYSFAGVAPKLKYYVEFTNGTSNIRSYTPTLKGAANENNSRVNSNWCSDVFTAIYQKIQ